MTVGCLENSDLKNSDPKKSDPLGVSKTQTLKTQTLRKPKNSNPKVKQIRRRVPQIITNRLVSRKLRLQTLKYRIVSYLESAEKIKRLAVENHAYTDHENNIQLVSKSTTGAKFSCVMVSQPAHVPL